MATRVKKKTKAGGRKKGSGLPPAKCLHCDQLAGGPGGGRGMCPNDYQAARRDVLAKRTTWEQLEAEGYALPSRKGQGPKQNGYKASRERNIANSNRSK